MTGGGSVEIRPLDGIEECRAASVLQDAVWGAGFSERVPASLLLVLPRVGGVSIGAFESGRLVGLVFGVTGVEDGEIVHWSDILAVDPEHRGRGIGRSLKTAQAEAARAAGAVRMYWTFDPLEARNAHLNLTRLGATVREYHPEFYGRSDSELHGALGTDRLIARWELRPGAHPPRIPDEPARLPVAWEVEETPEGLPVPGALLTPQTAPAAAEGLRIPVPSDIQALRKADPEAALRWRLRLREILVPALDGGRELRGFLRGGTVGGYLLLPLDAADGPSAPASFPARNSR